jgi:hypothetical protein
MESVLLLLPSQRIALPRGNEISLSSHVAEDVDNPIWSETMIRQVHGCLAELSGARGATPWHGGTLLLKQAEMKRRGDIGDGGMYM